MSSNLEEVITQIETKLETLEREREKLKAQIEHRKLKSKQLEESLQELRLLEQQINT